ncbi:MAG TPA: hypothetical protein DDZ89_17315 [Clostridiales bacterium]|nr:hypothetical protein [Clostridiales bacterium]
MYTYSQMYDVVVTGGGISGAMAAVAAAREGCKTLLIERNGALGGMGTLGLVQPITTWGIKGKYVLGGTGKQLLKKLASRSSDASTPMTLYGPTCDSEYLKIELERLCLDNGVSILYYGWVRDVVKDETGRILKLITLTKQGDLEIQGKTFVDATGDGDLCALCGVPFEDLASTTGQQGMTMMMIVSGINFDACLPLANMNEIYNKYAVNGRSVCYFPHPRKGSAYFNMTEVYGMSGLLASDLTKATLQCRKQAWDILNVFKKFLPGFENAYIEQTAPVIGVRETRRMKGVYILNEEDVKTGRNFEDRIARASCPVDVHFRNDGNAVYYTLDKSYSIPYRALLTNEVPNLIVCGRCISTDQAAHSSVRRMAPGFATGEAAGVAASMAARTKDARTISVPQLQEKLKRLGAILDVDN